jgi:DNA modification methylase
MPVIHNGDCVQMLKDHVADESVDSIFFSPPYDAMRNYGNDGSPPPFDLTELGRECFRVLKDGGMAGMVINDGTKDYAKSLTTFRTAIDWCDNAGFRLFETVVYHRKGAPGGWWTRRFRVDHEYILIFLKGRKPAYFDKEALKVPSKHSGITRKGTKRMTDGTTTPYEMAIKDTKCRGTVWTYSAIRDNNGLRKEHPASMPIGLAVDFIHAFTPPDGIVLDPMSGSGTTLVAAATLARDFIGIELNPQYVDLIGRRLAAEGVKDAIVGDHCVPNVYTRDDIKYLVASDSDQESN